MSIIYPSEFVPVSVVMSNTNEHILYHTESKSYILADRDTMNLRRRLSNDYRNLDFKLSCVGFYVFE